jgi:hypothetical protein
VAGRGEHSPGGNQPEGTGGPSGVCREHASEELTPASHADLAEYRLEVLLNGVAGDAQAVAELAGVEPVSQERDQLALSRRERVGAHQQAENVVSRGGADADRDAAVCAL